MSIRDLIQIVDQHYQYAAVALGCVPLIAYLLGWLLEPRAGERSPWKFIYSVLIYAACVPGIFAIAISAYSLFFRNEDLLNVSILTYLLPIASMLSTIGIMRKNVQFDHIPGFDRLVGLMMLMFVSFIGAFIIQRMQILLLFHGSFMIFAVIAIVLFVILKLSVGMVTGGKRVEAESRGLR